LYGLESANQATLDRLSKGYQISRVREELGWAKANGLEPHITVMVGYPWETEDDVARTVDYVNELFASGLVDTLQATILMPYPGTPLYAEGLEAGWLKTQDWDRYDMRESVIEGPLDDAAIRRYVKRLYRSFLTPRFIGRRLASVRSLDDLRFLSSAGAKVAGHLIDFRHRQPAL
jgi:radical SAM superfamily enzyme YgiQ (UPF0313 family)